MPGVDRRLRPRQHIALRDRVRERGVLGPRHVRVAFPIRFPDLGASATRERKRGKREEDRNAERRANRAGYFFTPPACTAADGLSTSQ
jgi:hypothetical protein